MLANTLLLLLLQFPVEVVVVAVVLIAVVVVVKHVVEGGGGDNPTGFSGNSVSTRRRSIINQAISFYYIYMTTNRKSIKAKEK